MLSTWPIPYIESGKGIALSRYKTTYGMSLHTHLYFEIEYILSGKCFQKFGNDTFEFTRGDIAFFKPDSRHSFHASSEIEILKIKLRPDILPEFYSLHESDFDMCSIIRLPSSEIKRVESIILAIEKEFNTQNDFYVEVILGYLEIIFALLLRINGMSDKDNAKSSIIDYKLIISFIEKNLKTVTPSSVAAYSGYNFPYFSKSFKKHIGTNLSEYINSVKLEKAARLLVDGNKNIESIGYDVGFNNKSYFYRVFKKHYGVTPKEYRNSRDMKRNNITDF